MQSENDAPVVERRAQSHREINSLVETRTDTLAISEQQHTCNLYWFSIWSYCKIPTGDTVTL